MAGIRVLGAGPEDPEPDTMPFWRTAHIHRAVRVAGRAPGSDRRLSAHLQPPTHAPGAEHGHPPSASSGHTSGGRDDLQYEQAAFEPELSVQVVEPPVLPPARHGDRVRTGASQRRDHPGGGQATSRNPPGTGRQEPDGLGEPPQRPLPARPAPGHQGSVPASTGGPRPPDHALRCPPGRSRAHSPALPKASIGTAILAAGEPAEVDRKVHGDGIVALTAAATRSDSPSSAVR